MEKKYIKLIKTISIVASIIGMIGSSWADSQENKMELERLIEDHYNKKG